MAKLTLLLTPILLIVIFSNIDSAQGQDKEEQTAAPKGGIKCMTDEKFSAPYHEDKLWIQGIESAHNKLRKKHRGTPSLTYNPALCGYAQYLADQNIEQGKLVHSKALFGSGAPDRAGAIGLLGSCGENLYESSGDFPKPEEIVNTWYNSKKDYDYKNPEGLASVEAGHFTQLVWKETTDFCPAKSDKGDRSVVAVVYYPKGNTAGGFKRNVLNGSPTFLPSAFLMAVGGIILIKLN